MHYAGETVPVRHYRAMRACIVCSIAILAAFELLQFGGLYFQAPSGTFRISETLNLIEIVI